MRWPLSLEIIFSILIAVGIYMITTVIPKYLCRKYCGEEAYQKALSEVPPYKPSRVHTFKEIRRETGMGNGIGTL